ncbi:hypothetical protein SEUCBS139899_009143 [Sporothrix eucalyptigena]|uniref:Uncharacterized protein n=1 Tax=Sporothrix eucalyptigena TaxID=1812306 RepID=A0ABP0CSD1_9PEZI
MASTMGWRNRRNLDLGQVSAATYNMSDHFHGNHHPETPQSVHSVFSGYSSYSYGLWDAFTPRSWTMPSPSLSPPLISWPLALASPTTPETAVSLPAFSLVECKSDHQRQAEHEYLFDKLRSRDGSIRRKLERMVRVHAELQRYSHQKEQRGAEKEMEAKPTDKDEESNKEGASGTLAPGTGTKITRGQARELRRQLWWLQHQIQQVEQDEEHLFMRLGEIMADMQARQWLAQIRQRRFREYGQQAGWLTQTVTLRPTVTYGYGAAGYFDAVPPHLLQAIPETDYNTVTATSPKTPTVTALDVPVLTHLTLGSPFVDSPITPGLHSTMPASPVSVAAVSAALVVGEHRGSCSAPMSPQAPVFWPWASSTAIRTSARGFLGMHYAREQDAAVFHEGDEDKETADSDVSDK